VCSNLTQRSSTLHFAWFLMYIVQMFNLMRSSTFTCVQISFLPSFWLSKIAVCQTYFCSDLRRRFTPNFSYKHAVADWPTGKPAPGRTRDLISLIISWHSRQIGSAFSTRVTTCAVWVHSGWANDGDVFYSVFTCRLRPTRIKTISNK